MTDTDKRRTVGIGQLRTARQIWPNLSSLQKQQLRNLVQRHEISISAGDLQMLEGKLYVTHSGLLRLACRNRCKGVHVEPVPDFSNAAVSRWAFKATVFTSADCKGFDGYGDADPSNVSPLMHGAEMRIAETRAVNRALRKAYGIGLCSVEELGFTTKPSSAPVESKKPVQPENGNYRVPRVRDRLCQLIRQHQLDPILVKSYAVDFCRTKTLREATREQVASFVTHLADWADKDRNALLCQLNSYLPAKGSAA